VIGMTVAFHPTQRERLRFMESLACWEGVVNRQRVCEAMHVSLNHLTRDFALYRDAYPDNLVYDISNRCYRPGPRFKPEIATGAPDEYLSLLRLHAESKADAALPWLPGPGAADIVPRSAGTIDGMTLQRVTRAIARDQGLSATYQSMKSPEPISRTLWPHALVFSGYRWHARAYDEQHDRFGDFVLARLTHVRGLDGAKKPPEAMVPADSEWQDRVTIDVLPAARLTEHQRDVVAREYGMKRDGDGWVWRVKMRRCLAPYFMQFYPLDPKGASSHIALREPALYKVYAFNDV